jgi:hypothetical protein
LEFGLRPGGAIGAYAPEGRRTRRRPIGRDYGAARMGKSKERNLNSKSGIRKRSINSISSTFDPIPVCFVPCPYNLISGIRNLFSVMGDILLYAPCSLLYALFARNPKLATRGTIYDNFQENRKDYCRLLLYP